MTKYAVATRASKRQVFDVTSPILRVASRELQHGVEVCSLAGEIDVVTAPRVHHLLTDGAARGVSRVVLDLSEVSFLGLAGVEVLAVAAEQTSDHGGRLSLVASHAVARTLEVTGHSQRFATYQNLSEALAVELVMAVAVTGRQP